MKNFCCVMNFEHRYRQTGKQIVLIGVNFDVATRNVAEWKIQKLYAG